ncbi:sensor domain-containing diguanylate cyclase [Pantoea sp. ACRSB]|uniref:sensor domain-containing diguanylate cyclase n=1 Tax=Pantoea sp. ACRSB TaxID=2918207 RepID=UPI002893282C|nr:sensor domain-containing diguanylate cyclase [Pantoea sp. ACRSB]MCG7390799.1 sensor domain-containing diguanylate cyclase [Pantoea sp. ACRSB]
MPSPRTRRTERFVLLFLLFISLFIVTACSWALWRSWQNRLQDVSVQARNQSLSLSRQAQDTFLQVNIALDEIARQTDQVFSHPEAYSGGRGILAGLALPLPQLAGLFVYDKEGNWLATSRDQHDTRLNNADRESFIWHRDHADAGVHIGKVIRSRSADELVIPVSLRLNDAEGNFRGVALGSVKVAFFRQFYGWYEQSPGDLLALMNTEGLLLYARPFPDSVLNRSLSSSPLFTRLLSQYRIGSATWNSRLDGQERLFGYARLERYPLVVAVGYETRAIRHAWWMSNITGISVNIFTWLLVLLFGFLVLRHLHANQQSQQALMRSQDELTRLNSTLSDLAMLDGLTGLGNRRQFDFYLEKSLEGAASPVSLIMFDVDYFKRYNDEYGHIAGDRCLQEVAAVLKHLPLRSTDRVTRYGGEEFAIILPGTKARDAENVAHRALEAIRRAALPHGASELPEKIVTLSAGISASSSGDSPDSLKLAADEALYVAKKAGRNCIAGTDGICLL